jgi:hypothetical protein
MHLLEEGLAFEARPSVEVALMARGSLEQSPYWSIRRVSCEYRHGLLFLRGRLGSFYHKQLAQEAVSDVKGVLQVVNEIEVVEA